MAGQRRAAEIFRRAQPLRGVDADGIDGRLVIFPDGREAFGVKFQRGRPKLVGRAAKATDGVFPANWSERFGQVAADVDVVDGTEIRHLDAGGL